MKNLLLLALICGLGCNIPPKPPPTPEEEAGVPRYSCATVCANARAHDCAFGNPTNKGVPCEQVCENIRTSIITWDLRCRSTAKTCGDADRCEQ